MTTLFDILNVSPAESVEPVAPVGLEGIAQTLAGVVGRGARQAAGQDTRPLGQRVATATKGLDTADPTSLVQAAQRLDAIGESGRASALRQLAAKAATEQREAQNFQRSSEALSEGLRSLDLPEAAELALTGTEEGYKTAETIYTQALDNIAKNEGASASSSRAGLPKPPLPEAQQEAIISQMRAQGATESVLSNLAEGLSSGAVQSYTDASKYLPIRDPLPDSAQRVLTETNDRAAEARSNFSAASSVLEDIYDTDKYANYRGGVGIYDDTGGFVADVSINLQNFLGGRTKYGLIRERFNRIVNSEAITNLPPGSTTEKELEIVKRGFPADNANLGQMIIFLEALKNVSEAAEEDAELQSRFYDGRAYFSGDIQQGEWQGFQRAWYDEKKKLEQNIKEQQDLLATSVLSPEAKAQAEREIEFLKAQFKQFVAISLSGGDNTVDPDLGFLPRGFE